MKTLLILLAAASLSLANLRADQLLYDADTGERTITLKDDGSLWYGPSSDSNGFRVISKIFAYLKGSVIYDRRYEVDRKHSEIIGYRKGNVLYRDDSPYIQVIGYFKKTNAQRIKD